MATTYQLVDRTLSDVRGRSKRRAGSFTIPAIDSAMSTPKSFFATLLERPEPLSPLARYTCYNGVLYMALGAGMYLGPPSILSVVTGTAPEALGSVRLSGMSMGIIGWFYFMGGRTGRDSFGLSTVVDRAAVPFLLGALVLTGQVPLQLVAGVAVLDPLLAVGAYLIWRRSTRAEG